MAWRLGVEGVVRGIQNWVGLGHADSVPGAEAAGEEGSARQGSALTANDEELAARLKDHDSGDWAVPGGVVPDWAELPDGPLLRIFEILGQSPYGLTWVCRGGRVCTVWRRTAQEILLGDTAASRPKRNCPDKPPPPEPVNLAVITKATINENKADAECGEACSTLRCNGAATDAGPSGKHAYHRAIAERPPQQQRASPSPASDETLDLVVSEDTGGGTRKRRRRTGGALADEAEVGSRRRRMHPQMLRDEMGAEGMVAPPEPAPVAADAMRAGRQRRQRRPRGRDGPAAGRLGRAHDRNRRRAGNPHGEVGEVRGVPTSLDGGSDNEAVQHEGNVGEEEERRAPSVTRWLRETFLAR